MDLTARMDLDRLEAVRPSRRALLKTSFASLAVALAAGGPRLAGASAATPVAATPVADADFAALDAFVAERMAALGVPGAAVGVVLGDQEHVAGFGVTSVEHPLPVDGDTLFQIGSTTKTITGTAMMRLVERGDLDLDAPVRAYLPEFRVADEAVSESALVRHLVTHTGGWFGDDFTDPGRGDDALAAYVAAMADLPQIAPLGEHFSYNNAAVNAAGRIVEVITGQPYETAVRELVLAPLGMDRSTFFAEEAITEATVVGHVEADGEPTIARPWGIPRASNPAGGVVSSVRDMLRYARFHLGDGTANGETLLSPESLAFMQEPLGPGASLGIDILDGVGVTWLLSTIDGTRLVAHGGSTNGQQASLVLVPERAFAIVVLTNADAGAALGAEATDWALARFLGLVRPTPVEQELDTASAAEYADRYGDASGIEIVVTAGDGVLHATATAGGEPIPDGDATLVLVGDDLFVSEFMGTTFYADFVRDAAGAVGWLRFSGRLLPRAA